MSYAYDTTGQVLSETDPAGNTTTYSYADRFFTDGGNDTMPASYSPAQATNAYLTSITDAIGTSTKGYYFGSGTEAITTDYNGQSAYAHYQDGLGRKTEEVAPIGWGRTTYSSTTQSDMYSAVGDASPSTASVSCKHSQTLLDSWGRTTSQILVNNPLGPVEVDSSYDTAGRLSTQSHPYSGSGDPNYVFESFGYDASGRQNSTTHPDGQMLRVAYGADVVSTGGLASQQGTASTYGYGYPQVSKNESGNLRQQWSDSFGRLVEVDEPDAAGNLSSSSPYTNYLYDAGDRLTKVVQGSQVRMFTYDGLGRKTSENTPEGGTVAYSYTTSSGGLCSGDPSNICARTDARGVVSTYTYNAANQPTGVSYTVPAGKSIASMPNVCTTSNGTAANICYYYSQGGAGAYAIGRQTKMTDPTGSETYSYDADGRLIQLSKSVNGQTFNLGYQYDAGGDVKQITYPSGRVVQHAYDAVGHLCEIAPIASGCNDASYYANGFTYNAPGKLIGFSYGNGVTAKSYYSPDRVQLVYLAYGKGNSNYFGLQYSYQQKSQYAPTCSHGTIGNNGTIQCITDDIDSGRSVGYNYDPLLRLSSANSCGSSSFPQWGLSESYDRYGNRLSQAVTVGSGPSTNMSFNSSNQPLGYNYDASGNMTVEPLLPANSMTYDGESRMTAFQGSGGSASYAYDGNGLRVVKSVQGGTTTVSIFSGSSVIAEYDNGAAPGSPSREYIYNLAGGATTGLLAMISNGATTYYHQDHLGVRFTTDANGNVLGQQGTFPFGESWYSNLGSGGNWLFTSYDRDSESGLDYALARYYDSRTGTFLMADPVAGSPSDPQSWNRYAYGRNNPIIITDPSGKFINLLIMFAANFAENLAVDFVSNSIDGHPGLSTDDVEGAAIGAALGTGEGYLNTKSFMPNGALARSPVHFAEELVNSLLENEALNGHARVDWANVALGTGIDMLDDYLTYKDQKDNAGACAETIISRIDQQFGTHAQVTGSFYSSTGAPAGTGTLNLNISIPADQPGVPASGYYGSTFSPIHIPSGAGAHGGLDSSNTLNFDEGHGHSFTTHIDSGNPNTLIGATWHFLRNMTGFGGYSTCR